MMTGAGIVPFTLLCNMLSNKNYFRKWLTLVLFFGNILFAGSGCRRKCGVAGIGRQA